VGTVGHEKGSYCYPELQHGIITEKITIFQLLAHIINVLGSVSNMVLCWCLHYVDAFVAHLCLHHDNNQFYLYTHILWT
jgi:hypothetical protein